MLDTLAYWSPLWRLFTRIQICASLNHRKKKKAEPSRLIPRKLTANLEVLTCRRIFSVFHKQVASLAQTSVCLFSNPPQNIFVIAVAIMNFFPKNFLIVRDHNVTTNHKVVLLVLQSCRASLVVFVSVQFELACVKKCLAVLFLTTALCVSYSFHRIPNPLLTRSILVLSAPISHLSDCDVVTCLLCVLFWSSVGSCVRRRYRLCKCVTLQCELAQIRLWTSRVRSFAFLTC